MHVTYLYGFGAIAFWSTNAVVAHHALQALDVAQVLFIQFLTAAIVFGLLKVFTHKKKGARTTVWPYILGTLGLTSTILFQYAAFRIGPITEVNVISYAWPLLVAVLLVIIRGSARPTWLISLAFIGFVGAGLVISSQSPTSVETENSYFGYMFAFASAACMALYSFMIGKVDVSPQDVLLPGAGIGAILTGLWCAMTPVTWPLSWPILLAFYLGVGPMAFGYILWSRALKHDASGTVVLFGYLTPVFSTLLLAPTQEHLGGPFIIGTILIVTSSILLGHRFKDT